MTTGEYPGHDTSISTIGNLAELPQPARILRLAGSLQALMEKCR